MMEEECVHRRRWLDRQHFLDLIAAVNFVPGPNSTELAIHLGLIRAGVPGLFVAGACFITPAVLIILPIAWLYVTYGSLPQIQPALRAINAAVVAIVLMALLRLIRPIVKDAAALTTAILSLAAALVLRGVWHVQPEIWILAVAAAIGAVVRATKARAGPLPMPMLSIAPGLLQIFAFFLKVGATLFGSGYVLISYLQSGLVDQRHWLSQQQVLDAVAVGQFTPGPLLTTATFIGYLLGHGRFNGGHPGGVS